PGHMDRIGVTAVPPGNIDDLAASSQRPVAGRDLPVFSAAGSQSVDVGLASPRVCLAKAARISSFSTADSASLIAFIALLPRNLSGLPEKRCVFFRLIK